MATVEWLMENGFRYLGQWDSPSSRVHRVEWLRHQPGVYAFVVDGEVRYVGKANALHRRLRNYVGRAFGATTGKEPRRVHTGIREAINVGSNVAVFVCLVPLAGLDTALQVESRLIKETRPLWNGPESSTY